MTSNNILNSLLEINLYILLISILWFIIKSKLSFNNQRLTALSIPVIGVLIWAVKPLLLAKKLVYSTTILGAVNVLPEVSNLNMDTTSEISWTGIYGLVTGMLLLYFVFKLIRVLWFFKGSVTEDGFRIKISNTEDSFSFFKFVHLRAGMDEHEKQVVLQHELIHCQKRHSFDLVVLEIFHSLFWINPLFFYLKKELVNIHEFEVDQEMYKTHKTNYMRHLLNYALGSVDSHYLLTSPFYNRLTITKRIKTMKTSKKSNFIVLFAIPVFAVLLAVVSCETNAQAPDSAPMPPPPPPIPTEYVQKGELTKQAEFPGGTEAMFAYMGENIKYSQAAKDEGFSGKVIVSFTVKEDGKIAFVQIKRGVAEELDQEAIRVVKNMPNWAPGEIDGKPVASQMVLPIMFALE